MNYRLLRDPIHKSFKGHASGAGRAAVYECQRRTRHCASDGSLDELCYMSLKSPSIDTHNRDFSRNTFGGGAQDFLKLRGVTSKYFQGGKLPPLPTP